MRNDKGRMDRFQFGFRILKYFYCLQFKYPTTVALKIITSKGSNLFLRFDLFPIDHYEFKSHNEVQVRRRSTFSHNLGGAFACHFVMLGFHRLTKLALNLVSLGRWSRVGLRKLFCVLAYVGLCFAYTSAQTLLKVAGITLLNRWNKCKSNRLTQLLTFCPLMQQLMNRWSSVRQGLWWWLTNPEGNFKSISLSIDWRTTRGGPADSSVQIRLPQQCMLPPNFASIPKFHLKPETLIARTNDALIGRCVKLLRKAAAQMGLDLYSCGHFGIKVELVKAVVFWGLPQQPGSAFWWSGDRSVGLINSWHLCPWYDPPNHCGRLLWRCLVSRWGPSYDHYWSRRLNL